MRAHTHIHYKTPKAIHWILLCLCVSYHPFLLASAYKIYGCVEPSDLDATRVRWGWVRFNHEPI